MDKIIAIIVTFNRIKLLSQCIDALQRQSKPLDKILIIDNGSTDGTLTELSNLASSNPLFDILFLPNNIGGAGGFHEGIRYASKFGSSWLWLMDDDACPEPNALEMLTREATNPTNIYGSVAVDNNSNGSSLCWPVTIIQDNIPNQYIDNFFDLPRIGSTAGLPFLGFMIHNSLVNKIGLPEKEYFISCDDIEYSLRALQSGSRINIIKTSIIRHPMPERDRISIFGFNINVLLIKPWKRYYDTRNRIFIAKKYYGMKLWTITLPGLVIRWLYALYVQDERFKQSKAFLFGIIDGLRGREGIRWWPGK